jgi:hypothetical protein
MNQHVSHSRPLWVSYWRTVGIHRGNNSLHEHTKFRDGNSRNFGLGCENTIDGRVGLLSHRRRKDHEFVQIILVGGVAEYVSSNFTNIEKCILPMPRYDVKWCVVLFVMIELSSKLMDDPPWIFIEVKTCKRCLEVSRVS